MTQPATTLSVSCNHCGAPLQVPAGTRYLTCTYCGSRLEVHQSQGAVYTEVLQTMDKIAEDVSAIRRQNELEQLDREWMLRRDSLFVRDKNGRTSTPSAAGSIIGGAVAAIFGIIWTIGAASAGAPAIFPLFGIAFVIVGIIAAIAGTTQASAYSQAERDYQQRREALRRQSTGQR